MRLTPSFSKNHMRVYSSLFCAVLFISPAAAARKPRHEMADHQWDVKYDAGTEEISEGSKLRLTVGKSGIVCRTVSGNGRQVVMIPATRVTKIGYETEYHSIASLAFSGDFGNVVERDPRGAFLAAPLYGALSLFERPRRLVKISWLSEDGEESYVVLRARKSDYRTILEMLESSTGKTSVDLWAEREKAIQNFWDNNPVPRDPIDVAGDKTLQKSIDALLQEGSVTAPIRLKHTDGSTRGTAFEEKRAGVSLCAVLAPDSDSYSVNCRRKDREIPRKLMPSSPATRQLSSLRSGAAPAGPR